MRKRLANGVDVALPEQVGAGDAEELAASQRPHRVARGLVLVVPGCRRREPVDERLSRAGHKLGIVGEQTERLGVTDEQLRHVSRHRQQARQPQRDRPLIAEQPQIPRGVAELLRHLPVCQEPPVGLGGVSELAQQHRQQLSLDRGGAGNPAGERLDMPQRPGRTPDP